LFNFHKVLIVKTKLMKKIILMLFVALGASAQDLVTQNRPVGSFSAVVVSSGIDLYLRQGNTTSLKLTAPENKIQRVITEVKDGRLHIYMEKPNWSWNWGAEKSPKVHLVFKDLNEIVANGGSDVFGTERLLFDTIKMAANGGSDLKIDLTAERLYCAATGGSDATITGTAQYLDAHASGGSDLKAKDLRSKYAKVHASGGSDAQVWVESQLDAHASGGSDVYYFGNPQVKKHESGGSDVRRK
jgi:hypothetical protein